MPVGGGPGGGGFGAVPTCCWCTCIWCCGGAERGAAGGGSDGGAPGCTTPVRLGMDARASTVPWPAGDGSARGAPCGAEGGGAGAPPGAPPGADGGAGAERVANVPPCVPAERGRLRSPPRGRFGLAASAASNTAI